MSLAREPAERRRVVREPTYMRTLDVERALFAICGAFGLLASGCALIIDTDREQCSDVSDCVKQLGTEHNYLCEQNLCRVKLECTSNDQCLSPGKGVCAAGSCVACAVNTDCDSPTATCVANVCEDPLWGCLKEPDNRPVPVASTATITAKVPNALTMVPLSELTVRVCLDSQIDANCMTPFPGATGTYDPATALATVVGIGNGRLYRLQLLPSADSGLTMRDFYTNRPARGLDQIPDDLGLVPISVLAGLPAPVAIDIKKPAINVRIFDCQGQPAENVTVALSDPPSDLVTVYLTETMQLRFDLNATTKRGYAGFLNAKSGVVTNLSAKIGAKELINYQFVAGSDRTVSIDLYPRVFSSN